MFKVIIGFALGLAVTVMFPELVANQVAKVQGLFNVVNVKTATLLQPAPREAEPLPSLMEKRDAGAGSERASPVPGNTDPALDYQTRSERQAVNRAQWLELYAQIFKSQEGQ